jgi:hypothetical protein
VATTELSCGLSGLWPSGAIRSIGVIRRGSQLPHWYGTDRGRICPPLDLWDLGVEEDFRPARKAHPGLLVRRIDGGAARGSPGYPATFDDDFPGMRRFYGGDPNGNRLAFLGPLTLRRG